MLLYDKIIVIDLEATCWKRGTAEAKQRSEIIEIGICKYIIATGAIEAKQSIYIKPVESTIGPFCTQLTGITPERVAAEGITLGEAAKLIKKQYSADKRCCAAWGEYDRKLLTQAYSQLGIDSPFGKTYLNIKALFTLKQKRTKGIGLEEAVELAGETFEGRPHSGADDAYNTAKLLRYVFG